MTSEDPSLLESNVEDFYLLFAYFLFKEGEIKDSKERFQIGENILVKKNE